MSGISSQVKNNILNPAKLYNDTHFYQSFELDPNSAASILGDPQQNQIGLIMPIEGQSPLRNILKLHDQNFYDLPSAQYAMEMYVAQQLRLQTPNYSTKPGLRFCLYTNPMIISSIISWDIHYFLNTFKQGLQPIAQNYSDDFSSLFQALANYDVTILSSSSVPKYYVEWFGYFQPPTTGTYQFNLATNQTAYIWVGNTALVNYTIDNSTPTNTVSPIHFVAGTMYPIRIHFGALNQTCTSTLSLTISCNGTVLSTGANGNGVLWFLNDNLSNNPYEPIQLYYALHTTTDPMLQNPPLTQFSLYRTDVNLSNNYTINQQIRLAKSNTNLKNYKFTISSSMTNTPALSITSNGSIQFGSNLLFDITQTQFPTTTPNNANLHFSNGNLILNMGGTSVWDILQTTTSKFPASATNVLISTTDISNIQQIVYPMATVNKSWLSSYQSATTKASILNYGETLSGNYALYSSDGKSMICIEGNDLNMYISNTPVNRFYTFDTGIGKDEQNAFYFLSTQGNIKLGSTMLIDTQQQTLQYVPMGGNILQYTNDFKLYSGSAYSYPPRVDGTNYIMGDPNNCSDQCIKNAKCSHYYTQPNTTGGVNCIINNNNTSPVYLPNPTAAASSDMQSSLYIRNKTIKSDCKINVYNVVYKTVDQTYTDSCADSTLGCPTKGINQFPKKSSLYDMYDSYSVNNQVYDPLPAQEGPCGVPGIYQSIGAFTESFAVSGFDMNACQSLDEKQCLRSMKSNADALNQAYQSSQTNNSQINDNYLNLTNKLNTQFVPIYNKINNNPQYDSISKDGTLTQNQNGRKSLLNGMIEDTKMSLIQQNTNYIIANICAAIFLVGIFAFVPE
jgi:GLEYA domain